MGLPHSSTTRTVKVPVREESTTFCTCYINNHVCTSVVNFHNFILNYSCFSSLEFFLKCLFSCLQQLLKPYLIFCSAVVNPFICCILCLHSFEIENDVNKCQIYNTNGGYLNTVKFRHNMTVLQND